MHDLTNYMFLMIFSFYFSKSAHTQTRFCYGASWEHFKEIWKELRGVYHSFREIKKVCCDKTVLQLLQFPALNLDGWFTTWTEDSGTNAAKFYLVQVEKNYFPYSDDAYLKLVQLLVQYAPCFLDHVSLHAWYWQHKGGVLFHCKVIADDG